jgi:hypothetical protein
VQMHDQIYGQALRMWPAALASSAPASCTLASVAGHMHVTCDV